MDTMGRKFILGGMSKAVKLIEVQVMLDLEDAHVAIAALGCPVERISTVSLSRRAN
jgi:hypothetical protein